MVIMKQEEQEYDWECEYCGKIYDTKQECDKHESSCEYGKKPKIYESMSKTEKDVADFLTSHKIWWQYEHPVHVNDDKNRPRIWTPDFFLTGLGIYVEVCGSEKFDYSFREKIYEKNNLTIIFVHHFKPNWKSFLIMRIKDIHEMRNKFVSDLKSE